MNRRRMLLGGLGIVPLLAQEPKKAEKLAPYYPTPNAIVEKMLQLGGAKKGEKMFDLGSGDGRAEGPMARACRAAAAGATGMMAEEVRCFCRVVRGAQAVPVGATYGDALQVQEWMDRLTAGLDHNRPG